MSNAAFTFNSNYWFTFKKNFDPFVSIYIFNMKAINSIWNEKRYP